MEEQKKSRLQRICIIAKYIILAGIALVTLILFAMIVLGVFLLLDPDLTLDGMDRSEIYLLIILTIINQIISILIFYYLYRLTKSIGDESSPFTSANVKLLKYMALILLIGWVFGMVVDLIVTSMLSLEFTGFNADALVMAGVIYVVSLVFEYGVRLQEDSDSFV